MHHPSEVRRARTDLHALGWTPERTSDLDPALVPGRVTRVDRGRVLVTTESGTLGALLPGDDPVVTGDWVGLVLDPRPAVAAVVPKPNPVTSPARSRAVLMGSETGCEWSR